MLWGRKQIAAWHGSLKTVIHSNTKHGRILELAKLLTPEAEGDRAGSSLP